MRELMMEDTSKKTTKSERKIEHELLWIVGFAVILVLVFLATQHVIRWTNEFDYENLHFTKTKFGEIQVFHYYYTWVNAEKHVFRYNLYLRTDPRKNTVPVSERPILLTTKRVFVTLNVSSGLDQCEDSNLAIGDLALFLKDNQFNIASGIMDIENAEALNQSYITCATRDAVEVIEITRGSETAIQATEHCTHIVVGPNCDILNATEKLKTIIVADAKKDAAANNSGVSYATPSK